MKIVTVLGARPQFIKAAPVSSAFRAAGIEEVLVHTGQHYDANMSDIFFQELGLPKPGHALGVGSGSQPYQVSEGLKRLEPVLAQEKPDAVLVYGDTNATLVGAFVANTFQLPVAHVEAGLRSFNRAMPEETNRILTDQLSTWCLAPTKTAMQHLANAGLQDRAYLVGDVMLDALLQFQTKAHVALPNFWAERGVEEGRYSLLTMHRAETTAAPEKAVALLHVLEAQGQPILFPVHPRTRALVEAAGPFKHIRCMEPLGYLEMILAESGAAQIITDSGGVQKEAAMLGVPCVTLRTETEWVETLDLGVNTLVGLSTEDLQTALDKNRDKEHNQASSAHLNEVRTFYGIGQASQKIVEILQGSPLFKTPVSAC
jgi:UDP-GlcNAc3NAcA epimerase